MGNFHRAKQCLNLLMSIMVFSFFFFFFFFIALFGSSIACPLVFSVLHLSYQDEEFVINY